MDQEYFGTRRTTVEPKCSLSHYTELSAEPFVPKGRKSKNVCLRRQNSRTLPRITRADPGARRCVRVARGGAATSGATACRSTYAARRVTRRVRRTELYWRITRQPEARSAALRQPIACEYRLSQHAARRFSCRAFANAGQTQTVTTRRQPSEGYTSCCRLRQSLHAFVTEAALLSRFSLQPRAMF